jgi:RNA polymerase sigma factor (sigma-70 family)
MNASSLRCVLRHAKSLTGDLSGQGDAELLRLFKQSADESAFAALVARHGPMVWSACRNLLPDDSDADDAFQATFLTFIRSTPNACTNDSLAGWLHRVAYRIALKSRRSAHRRREREGAVAAADRTNAVPESAWDRLLAAVHEEVNRLPDSLRLPFVLCCLEGRRTIDAATELNVKLGTLSGRLTRAKQRLLDRLAQRGWPVAVVAGSIAMAAATGSAAVPAVLFEETVALSGTTGPLPSSIVHLYLGVMEMNMTRTKLIGSVLLVSGLLIAGVGPAVVPWASAQTTPKPAADLPNPAPMQPRAPVASKWEYAYIEATQPMAQNAFEAACRRMEPEGWEFCGTQEMTLDRPTDKGKRGPETVLVFKRPARWQRLASDARMSPSGQTQREATGRYEVPRREMAPSREANTRNETIEKPPLVGSSPQNPPAAKNKQGNPLGNEAAARYAEWTRGARTADSIEIISLEDASAEKMAKLLTELFGKLGTFQADERSNSLVIKTDAKTLDEVRALLERLNKQATMRRERDKARYGQKQ